MTYRICKNIELCNNPVSVVWTQYRFVMSTLIKCKFCNPIIENFDILKVMTCMLSNTIIYFVSGDHFIQMPMFVMMEIFIHFLLLQFNALIVDSDTRMSQCMYVCKGMGAFTFFLHITLILLSKGLKYFSKIKRKLYVSRR